MSSCPACLRRALRDLAYDSSSIPNTSTLLLSRRRVLRDGSSTLPSRSSPIIVTRSHATYDSLARGHHRRTLRKALESDVESIPVNRRRKGADVLTKGEIKDAMARTRNRENLLIKNTEEDRAVQRRMKKEVELYNQDPLQLALKVKSKLRIPDFGAALNLTRASDGIVPNNIVSWNHLIDYCMSQSDTDQAWKVYQEVKKRGHKPDAHTYTIMLRGFGKNTHRAKSGERAVGIYNSMFSPNSGVTPNTIHTNAVLNVCARSGDMDSLWAIAGRLPDRGPGSPDQWTFTTILNAVREDATNKVGALLKTAHSKGDQDGTIEEQQTIIFDQALSDGRKLWADVSYRWRRADLMVDEPLVCAMGRLILGCGTKKDFAEIFDLVDQTMNTRVRGRKRRSQPTEGTPQVMASAEEQVDIENNATDSQSDGNTKPELAQPITKSSSDREEIGLPLSESVVYATPSNNTLSMIIEASQNLKAMAIGKSYWTILTDRNGKYKVEPDAENIITYLRLLRISRSSVAALELLSQYWPAQIASRLYRRGVFVIAMSTCVRDKNSPLVFDTADKLLTLMETKLEEQNLGMFDASMAESDLTFKERLKKRKERIANVDETFGEEEGQAEFQRSKQGVESLRIDPKALRMYIDLATITTKGWSEGLGTSKHNEDGVTEETRFSRDPKQNHTLRALKRIHHLLPSIRRLAKLKVEESEFELLTRPRPKHKVDTRFEKTAVSDRAGTRVAERLEDLFDLLKAIVSAYDKVIMMAERFEDQGLEPMDEKFVERIRDEKRMVSGFLSRSKEVAAKATARRSGAFVSAAQARQEDEDDDADDDFEDIDSDSGDSPVHSPRDQESKYSVEERKITKELKRVYDDTSRDLSRTESRSRRQRNEVRRGVAQRMERRFPKKDYGTVGPNLEITHSRPRTQARPAYRSGLQKATGEADTSRKRMERRAFEIGTAGKSGRSGSKNNYEMNNNKQFAPWGAASFEELSRSAGQPKDSFVKTG